MMCYSDYWLGALLLAFESHQKGPLERTAGLPIVVGFPESHRITGLQVNVPPAAMVAFLAGRAYRLRTCPTTKYTVDPSSRLPQVSAGVPGGLAGMGGGRQTHGHGSGPARTAA